MKKLIVCNNLDDKYVNQIFYAHNRLRKIGKIEKILLNELTVDYLIDNKIKIVIANQLPLDWVYTLKGMKIVSLVLGKDYLYNNKADIAIDFLGSDSIKHFSGKFYSLENTAFNFEEVSGIIRLLDWDSFFFGFPISLVGSKYLTENIQLLIEDFAKSNQLKLIQYLCNCHDDISVKVAEENRYHFTDIRLTFQYKFPAVLKTFINDTSCRLANESHIVDLISMTEDLYKDSRYFYDGNFDLTKINHFYSEWLIKAIKGTFDHECYAWFIKEKPVAFCTVRYSSDNQANVGLFGVHKDYSGKGYGKKLLLSVIEILAKKRVMNLEVVTQGRNYAAQRLYQSVGFKTKETELWYHKWYK